MVNLNVAPGVPVPEKVSSVCKYEGLSTVSLSNTYDQCLYLNNEYNKEDIKVYKTYRKLINKYWPGPLTLLFKANNKIKTEKCLEI